jgi:hypothetical protein
MAMSPYYGRKGPLTDLVMTSLDDPTRPPLVLATPTFTLNKGVELTEIMAAAQNGEMTLRDQFIQTNRPTITMEFPVQSPETMGLREGMRPVTDIDPRSTWVALSDVTFSEQEVDARIAGQEGFGVLGATALTSAQVGYLDDEGVTQPVTLEAHVSGTPPVGPTAMAIGDDFAIALSADLVGKSLSILCPNQLAGITYLSEAAKQENFGIKASFVTRPVLRTGLLILYKALLNPSSGDISLGAEQNLSIEYSVLPPNEEGKCALYDWQWLPYSRKC